MSANEILIAGNVKGNIYADSKLEMSSGGKIDGDITTKKLKIADNVDFKGKVSMLDKPTNIDIFSVTAAEYKEAVLGKTENDEKSENSEDDSESSDEE